MQVIEEIFRAKIKPKEKVSRLSDVLKSEAKSLPKLLKYYAGAPNTERGLCLEAIECLSAGDPHFAAPCIEFVLDQISDRAPNIKRESSRIVANVAGEFPEIVVKAIPKLLENTTDGGTVVRWSAALALTAIAKYNPKTRVQLVPIFTDLAAKDENNGVKSIYLKALKQLEKEGSVGL